jgi:hypothetical protein
VIAIGIDPGVTTGFAVWDGESFKLVEVRSLGIIKAMMAVLHLRDQLTHALGSAGLEDLIVIVEDARKRNVFAKADLEEQGYKQGARREGVGSIKRDCSIWEEFLSHHGIPFEMRRPVATKMKADRFELVTGWAAQTNEHARDAAMIVFQLNRQMLRIKLQTYKEQRERGDEQALHPRQSDRGERAASAAGRRLRNAIRYGRRRR